MSAARQQKHGNRKSEESPHVPVGGGKPMDRLPMIRRVELAFALALTVVIVFLHVYRAFHAGGLWRDEVATIDHATLPSLSGLWASLMYGTHPLLIYCVVRIWTGIRWLGSTDTSLRALGALIGVGVVAALWSNKRLLEYHVPFFSLVLFGLNPTVIQWGDSLRGYGLGSLLVLLSYGLIWKVVEAPTPGRVVLATLISVLSVQCLYQNAILVFAICLGGFLVCLRKGMWKRMLVVGGIGAISALSFLPYLPEIKQAQGIITVALRSSDLTRIRDVFAAALSADNAFLLWAWLSSSGICIIVTGYLLIFKRKDEGYERRLGQAIFSLTILVFAPVAAILFTREAQVLTEPWHYIIWMGPIALSMDVLFEIVTTTIPKRILRLVFFFAVALLAIPTTWKQVSFRQTNLDVIASMLKESASPGDLIVVDPWFCGITFRYYYRGSANWTTLPPIRQLEFVRYDLLKEQMEKENPLQPVFDTIERSLTAGNRIWWVGYPDVPPEGQLPPSLPPAPHGSGGWWSGDYLKAWSLQLGHFITSHASSAEKVNLQIHQPVNIYENLPLTVIKGWSP